MFQSNAMQRHKVTRQKRDVLVLSQKFYVFCFRGNVHVSAHILHRVLRHCESYTSPTGRPVRGNLHRTTQVTHASTDCTASGIGPARITLPPGSAHCAITRPPGSAHFTLQCLRDRPTYLLHCLRDRPTFHYIVYGIGQLDYYTVTGICSLFYYTVSLIGPLGSTRNRPSRRTKALLRKGKLRFNNR